MSVVRPRPLLASLGCREPCWLDRSPVTRQRQLTRSIARSRGLVRSLSCCFLTSRVGGARSLLRAGLRHHPRGGKGSVGVVGALRAPVCCVSGNGGDSAAISVVVDFLPSRRIASHRVVCHGLGGSRPLPRSCCHAVMRTLYPSQVGVIDLARWSDLQLLASSRRCMIATIVGPGVQPIALISLACHNDDGPCWLLPLNLYILGFLARHGPI
jgi:hypothetical protein